MNIQLPLNDHDIAKLHIGQLVYLSGPLYTARDAAHLRLTTAIAEGCELPIALQGETIYYAGPCPAPPDHVIGAAGPTTSARMDNMTLPLMEFGLKGTIGKGPRSQEVVDAIQAHQGVYFIACGGAGALLAQRISDIAVVAYSDLGTESVKRLQLENFPVIVAIDSYGENLFAPKSP